MTGGGGHTPKGKELRTPEGEQKKDRLEKRLKADTQRSKRGGQKNNKKQITRRVFSLRLQQEEAGRTDSLATRPSPKTGNLNIGCKKRIKGDGSWQKTMNGGTFLFARHRHKKSTHNPADRREV